MNPGLDEYDKKKLRLMRDEGIEDGAELERRVGDTPSGRAERGRHTVCEISERDCESLQRAHEEGIGGHRLAKEFRMSKSTVHYHLSGECSHVYSSRVDEDKCVAIREAGRDGLTDGQVSEILDNVSRQQSRHHRSGDCACTHNVPPVKASRGKRRA